MDGWTCPEERYCDYGSNPHISALRTDGSITTFSADATTGEVSGEFTVPGPFEDLAAGPRRTCGVTVSGDIRCWSPGAPPSGNPPDENFERVAVGFSANCGLRSDGSVSCRGELARFDEWHFSGSIGEFAGPFVALAMGSDYGCGILADGGGLECWGTHVR